MEQPRPPGPPHQVPTVAQQDIVRGLHELGLVAGAVVEVHSSLRAFGRVDGGAETVIAALMNVVGLDGTLVMSAYPVTPPLPLTADDQAQGITWKVRWLPEASAERTGMGLVADTFRQRPDVLCGSSRFRTCAWGRDAEWHLNGYHGLLAVDGWCLLLGVGIDRCSSMHAAEDVPLPPEISAYFAVPEEVRHRYDPDTWSVGYGGTPEDAWQKVYRAADQQGLIRHTSIGQARCHLFKARSMLAIYKAWRVTDPFGLYGVPNTGLDGQCNR